MEKLQLEDLNCTLLCNEEMHSVNGGSFDYWWAVASEAAWEVEKAVNNFVGGFADGFDKSYTITKG